MHLPVKIPFELIFWILAIVLLWNVDVKDSHFSLCPIANAGFEWCPGCGIGRSIALLLQGNLQESFKMHWFGVPALVILTARIWVLTKKDFLRKIQVKQI